MELDLSPAAQALVDRVAKLAREKFAARAAYYDQSATFPAEDFDELFQAGLNAPCVPEEYGGLGLGPLRREPFALWMMTKELARVDLSVARCWEGHTNMQVLLDGMGSEAQKQRWFEGIVQRGEMWVGWGGEPQTRAPGEEVRFGTTCERVSGGYVVNGTKAFSTSAGAAHWALLFVNTAGVGGVRHATAAADTQLTLACDTSDASITLDSDWWDPIGMRATVSYLVHFDHTFIPEENVLGYPGQYLKEAWQTRFITHFAASFLGAAEAAYDYARDHLTAQNKHDDPYVQHHIAKMLINVETGHLWLRHVARLWERAKYDEAKVASSRARHIIEHLAEDTVKHAIQACGARALNRPAPIERIYRDLSFYVRHENDDHSLAMIGKSILGLPYDASFYRT